MKSGFFQVFFDKYFKNVCKNILYIGYGNMGLQVAKQLESSLFLPRIFILNSKQNGVLAAVNAKIKVDIVCIFTKPQDTASILGDHSENLRKILTKKTIIISIMAGRDYDFATKCLTPILQLNCGDGDNSLKYVRYMPNMAVKWGLGVGSVHFKNMLDGDKKFITRALSKKSQIIEVADEKHIDALTACFGSGIAFVAQTIQCFADSVKDFLQVSNNSNNLNDLQIDTNALQKAVITLFCSCVKQASDTNYASYTDFISKICSKGGTTIAGLDALNSQNLTSSFYKAFEAALNRAIALKQGN